MVYTDIWKTGVLGGIQLDGTNFYRIFNHILYVRIPFKVGCYMRDIFKNGTALKMHTFNMTGLKYQTLSDYNLVRLAFLIIGATSYNPVCFYVVLLNISLGGNYMNDLDRLAFNIFK